METGGTQLARSSLVPCCESAAPFSSCGGPGLLSAAVFLCLLFFHRADCAFRGCSVMTARIRSLTPASPWLANAPSPGRCRGKTFGTAPANGPLPICPLGKSVGCLSPCHCHSFSICFVLLHVSSQASQSQVFLCRSQVAFC